MPQCGHTASGGWLSCRQREQRATTSVCAAAALQYGADCSSGTGNGRFAVVTG